MNQVHSVSVRLLELSKRREEDHHFVLVRYGSERLLHRMASHPVLKDFVLKGATLFLIWEGAWFRATRDIDLLGFGPSDLERIEGLFRELCAPDTSHEDALVLDAASLRVERIKEDQHYQGARVTLVALLGRTRIPLQVDIGFGDAVTPAVQRVEFPTLLGDETIPLLAYPVETVVSEKFLAIATLGLANTRFKDYYDLLVLSRRRSPDAALCAQAIRNTCRARGLEIPERIPVGLTSSFADDPDKIRQWKTFVHRNRLAVSVGSLADVVDEVSMFLDPILELLHEVSR